MNKHRCGLSVITYTYNDHALAAGLLASMKDWDCLPREILVVDDGSRPPFVPPPCEPRARVIRLPANQGPAQAKIAGLGAAASRFLLSLDADIRLPPDWVSRCLPAAARDDTGLVATAIVTDAGEGLLAAYQRLCFSPMAGRSGEPKVMPAGVWLLRREVWARHGFPEYRERLHEDVYFSDKLRRAGLGLRVLPGEPARQIRRLSRHTTVRRGWTWQGREYLAAVTDNPVDPVNAFLLAMRGRMESHQAADPRFGYYDYLYAAYALASLARASGRPVAFTSALAARLASDLPGPEPADVFRHDMAALGFPSVPSGPDPLIAAIRRGLRSILPAGFDAAVAGALPHLREEDRRGDWDFSLYDG
uniref:Glycosyl transferase n=1 Tax=Desulfovibrio sp. U5L TaxID=596152 RepID=I2PZE5_9BACT